MKMLKHILAFLALILVSLAPVYADEGYIPYLPDFLEPDGIGYRGSATINTMHCWASYGGPFYEDFPLPQKCNNVDQYTFSKGESAVRSSPVTLEYRKNISLRNSFIHKHLLILGKH